LICAILFIASFVFVSFARDASTGWLRFAHQVYLLAITGTYLVYCQTHGGQTLGMKTWRIVMTDESGHDLDLKRALWRFPLAELGWASGVSIFWSIWDAEGQFLHDRLAGTRILAIR
jgi:uncharacterized RDD family membrane protein YckC